MNQIMLLGDKQHFSFIFITVLALLGSIRALPWTDPPIHPSHPFQFMWNAPTEDCRKPLDLSLFPVVTSPKETAFNESIFLFYASRFGKHPHVNEKSHKSIHGAIPQNLEADHYDKAKNDINHYIPGHQQGLAVIDFEEWRPLWIRNWGSKDYYRQLSIEKVMMEDPSKSNSEAKKQAEKDFTKAARDYFTNCIRLGKEMRPNRLWGYYLFPDCYNYEYNNPAKMPGYTGECPEREKDRNDQLLWLWQESTALYPSIYLEKKLRNSRQARMYVRHRIYESMRVSTLPNSNYSIPIYAFIRPLFKDTTHSRLIDYMSEGDLVSTVGEAAALGAAGIISWGDGHIDDNEHTCNDADHHLQYIMNPYIMNVSTASQFCSEALCQSRGRCVRKQWDKDVYLHLDPTRHKIQRHYTGGWTVTGNVSQDDINWFDSNFNCMCFGEEPCESVLKLKVLNDAFLPTNSRGDGWLFLLLVVMILLLNCQYLLRLFSE